MKHTPHTKHTTFRTPFTAKDNAYRHIRWTGSANNLFACDLDASRHETLALAAARRDYLVSPEGKREIAAREAARVAKREYDTARNERKSQESIAMQWKRADQGYYEDEVLYV